MKRAVLALLVAAAVAGCGSDDDGGDAGETQADTQAAAPPPTREQELFESESVPFTFNYPRDFDAQVKPQDDVLGQVSAGDEGPLNAIKVRKTADQELAPARYLDEFQRDFAETVGEVAKRREAIGGQTMGVLEFEDTLEQDGEEVDFSSSSYFFTGAGRTWQLECIADDEHRDAIEEACRAALESLEFTDDG